MQLRLNFEGHLDVRTNELGEMLNNFIGNASGITAYPDRIYTY